MFVLLAAKILYHLFTVYILIIFITGILKMTRTAAHHPVVRFMYKLVDPPCQLLTKLFPRLIIRTQTYWIDLSPMILIALVGIAQTYLPSLLIWVFKLWNN